jgi:hypothetical protein
MIYLFAPSGEKRENVNEKFDICAAIATGNGEVRESEEVIFRMQGQIYASDKSRSKKGDVQMYSNYFVIIANMYVCFISWRNWVIMGE